MGDDGILSNIGDVVGEVADEAFGELKKFGQSATAQISGHSPQVTGQPTKADVAKAKSAISGSPVQDKSAVDDVGDFGKSFLGQITGHVSDVGEEQIAELAKKDSKFSNVESAKVKQKINQIYAQHAAAKAREQQQEEVVEEQQEEQEKQLAEEQKKEDLSTNPSVAKTRAEIKNYGAE